MRWLRRKRPQQCLRRCSSGNETPPMAELLPRGTRERACLGDVAQGVKEIRRDMADIPWLGPILDSSTHVSSRHYLCPQKLWAESSIRAPTASRGDPTGGHERQQLHR